LEQRSWEIVNLILIAAFLFGVVPWLVGVVTLLFVVLLAGHVAWERYRKRTAPEREKAPYLG
jgi:uncharacterized membrane protein